MYTSPKAVASTVFSLDLGDKRPAWVWRVTERGRQVAAGTAKTEEAANAAAATASRMANMDRAERGRLRNNAAVTLRYYRGQKSHLFLALLLRLTNDMEPEKSAADGAAEDEQTIFESWIRSIPKELRKAELERWMNRRTTKPPAQIAVTMLSALRRYGLLPVEPEDERDVEKIRRYIKRHFGEEWLSDMPVETEDA